MSVVNDHGCVESAAHLVHSLVPPPLHEVSRCVVGSVSALHATPTDVRRASTATLT